MTINLKISSFRIGFNKLKHQKTATGNTVMKEIDYNEKDERFALLQSTIANGVRQSASSAFLYPFAGR